MYIIGLITIAAVVAWTRFRPSRLAFLPAPLVAVAIGIVATGALTQTSAAQQLFANPSLGAVLATQAALSVAGAYVSIVCMRAIGLYYRHFSERFPWTAG